jgi:hypothetical protein
MTWFLWLTAIVFWLYLALRAWAWLHRIRHWGIDP